MPYGHIKRIVPEHGFGFIVDDTGLDWFFVIDDVRDGIDTLWVDEYVGFSYAWTAQGPRATDIYFVHAE